MSNESRTKKSINNIIGGMMFRVVAMVFPFVIKTVMIKKLGVEYLGLNSLFSSILMVLSLSELGVGSALVFNMYKPIAENDTQRVCALLKVYRDFYRIIGCIILGIGLCLLPALKHLISGNVPSDINIYVLYLIYLANTTLSYFLFAYKKSLWEASQCNGIENRLCALTNTFMYTAQIFALLFTSNYYVYIIFLPLSTLLLNLIRNYRVSKMYPQYECRGKLENGFIKTLYKKVSALLGHKIGTTIIVSADSIVISSILGLGALAIYSNYYQITNSLICIFNVIYIAMTASIGNSIVTENRRHVYENFNTLTFLNAWLVSWASVCMFCLYQPFMRLWMGEKLLFDNKIVVLFVIYFYSWLIRRIGLTYKDGAGMWEQDFWKPYIGAIVNLAVNIVLCKLIGVAGVLISTIVVMIVIYFPWETWVLFKKLFKCSAIPYLIRMVMYAAVMVIACGITYIICTFIRLSPFVTLILRGVVCMIVPNLIFLAAYFRLPEFRDGKARVMGIIKEKLKK